MIRQPIVTILGHVDHGKTSLLDRIRGSAVAAKEAGGITQAIGASILPLSTIRAVCGQLLDSLKLTLTISGLLFIDTPGHAVFTNLRKRGGNLADIAILVIDINEGIMPQTVECIEILRAYKTPFVIAANKLDLLEGWRSNAASMILKSFALQEERALRALDTALYSVVGRLGDLGIQSERFDRLEDHTKQIAIIPVSARTGEGIAELLMVLTGLAQKYLGTQLESKGGAGHGTVLEVKEEKGLGIVMDVILYDGFLRAGDTVVIGGIEEPIVAKVRSLLSPAPLADMRERKTRFVLVKEVQAATGVRVSASGIDNVIAGVPLIVANDNLLVAKEEVQKEVTEALVATSTEGVIIKADTLGSLEALSKLLQDRGILVQRASVGPITKKDLSDAEANREKNPFAAVVLGFNVAPPEGVTAINIITSDIIYRILEQYEEWKSAEQKRAEQGKLSVLVRPAKMQLLVGDRYLFRQSNPAVVGMEVLSGTLLPGKPLMKEDGTLIGNAKDMESEQEHLKEAKRGTRAAISLPDAVIGRNVRQGDILYTVISENDFRAYKDMKASITEDEKDVLREIAKIMRKKNSVWGL